MTAVYTFPAPSPLPLSKVTISSPASTSLKIRQVEHGRQIAIQEVVSIDKR